MSEGHKGYWLAVSVMILAAEIIYLALPSIVLAILWALSCCGFEIVTDPPL
jgi:hypothetical protein